MVFSGRWPGLVGLLNTGACLAAEGRGVRRIWTDADTWTDADAFMARLETWCENGRVTYVTDSIRAAPKASTASALTARAVHSDMFRRRPIA